MSRLHSVRLPLEWADYTTPGRFLVVEPVQRRLCAIIAADVVGYTRLVEHDTEGTVAAWRSARDEIITPTVKDHSGGIVKLTGDGFLAEFPTSD